MSLTLSDIDRIANLARLDLELDEAGRMLGQINSFFDIALQLGAVDTTGIEPLAHPVAAIQAHPQGPTWPVIWILGSSNYGAQLAAHFGLPYAYAYFFSDGQGVEEALDLYRSHYRPSERHPRPQATICVWALAADTTEEAQRLLMTREHWRIGFERGLRLPLVSPEEAAAAVHDDADRARIAALRRRAMVGTGDEVASRLRELENQLGLDEIVVNTWTYDPAARRHSYTLLAQAFQMA